MNEMEKKLKQALTNLASSAEEQIDYLKALGVAPSADELALELDDITYVEDLPVIAQERAKALRNKLKEMSGAENHLLWNFEALRSAQEWEEVREMAKFALEALPN